MAPPELPGNEFEALLEDAFRHLGYENVRQSVRPDDGRRELVMEEVIDGRRRTVVVDPRRTDVVDRPTVERLHETVVTDEYDGPIRGMVVTTGRFSDSALEYARSVRADRDGGVDLLDGADLQRIVDELEIDPDDGTIEVHTTEALRPTHPTADRDAPVYDAIREVDQLEPSAVSSPEATATLEPMAIITARTSTTIETAAGLTRDVDETDDFVVHADRDRPRPANESIRELLSGNAPRVDLEDRDLEATFDDVERLRFGGTETEYREWAVERLRGIYSTTVDYPNEEGERTRTPNRGDVAVQAIDPVYLSHVRSRFSIGAYEYRLEYYAAGPSRMTTRNDLRSCVHCGETGDDRIYCRNCGSVNCEDHVRTERVEGDPVCVDCAVTERFALRTKYFYDAENRAVFREAYAGMSLRERAMENVPLVAASVVAALIAAFVALSVAAF